MIDNSEKIISVITINLNDKLGLQRTVESVKTQNNSLYEHIIIDGGSTDGSVELIKENALLFSYSISEPDKGVYDAQNKGIAQAKGAYLIFLNSGDTFCSNKVLDQFANSPVALKHKVIYGNSNIIKGNGAIEKLIPPNQLSTNFWYRQTLNHQAIFFKKDIFERFGKYNTSYRFSADMDLLLKIFKKEPEAFYHLNEFVCNYVEAGLSAKPENYESIIKEKEQILKSYLSLEEYKRAKENYLNELPYKTRLRIFVSERPLLKSLTSLLFPKK
jgi:glycosyltransferase involved in cell wall biosynthesis